AACARLAAAGVASAQAFIVGGAAHGAWDERYVLSDDEAQAIGEGVHAMANRRPTPSPEPTPDPTPADPPAPARAPTMAGLGMFVWYLANAENGDPAAICARAHAVGLRYVLVKCGDGAQPWRQFTPELVAALRAGGLEVYGWAYCYGEDVE